MNVFHMVMSYLVSIAATAIEHGGDDYLHVTASRSGPEAQVALLMLR